MNPIVPILFLGALAFGFAAFSIVAGSMSGPRRYNRAKLDAYECGIDPTPQPIGGGRFPVKYYLTAMLFILFDIEIVFLYPWAVLFDRSGRLRPGRDAAVHRDARRRLRICVASWRARVGLALDTPRTPTHPAPRYRRWPHGS